MLGVKLTRHLRKTIHTSNRYICVEPITNKIYRLFLQDTKNPFPDRPRHCEEDLEKPVTGVRGSDAIEFLDWVNDITNGEPAYRLPTRFEINALASRRTLNVFRSDTPTYSIWSRGSDARNRIELWTADGVGLPYSVEALTIVQYLCQDIQRSASVLVRLLLIQSLVIVNALTRAAAHAPDVDSVIDDALQVAHSISIDLPTLKFGYRSKITRHITRLRKIAYELSRVRAITHHNSAKNLEPNDNRVRKLVRDLESIVVIAQSLDFGRDFDYTLDRDLNSTLGLDYALDYVLERDNAKTLRFDISSSDYGCNQILGLHVGKAFAQALTTSLSQPVLRNREAETFTTDFRRAFVDATHIGMANPEANPDSLARKLKHAQAMLRQLLDEANQLIPSGWIREVSANLESVAVPIFTRQRYITPDSAATIRLAALCLATQSATLINGGHCSGIFREIAAGATLLEERYYGHACPTETILLSVDR